MTVEEKIAREQQKRLNGLRMSSLSEAIADAINAGSSAEDIRRAVIDGVLTAMDYDSAGPFANKIINKMYR